jgi:hypothetical protein
MQKEAMRPGGECGGIKIGEENRERMGCSDPKGHCGNEAEHQVYLQQSNGGRFHKTIVISEG